MHYIVTVGKKLWTQRTLWKINILFGSGVSGQCAGIWPTLDNGAEGLKHETSTEVKFIIWFFHLESRYSIPNIYVFSNTFVQHIF